MPPHESCIPLRMFKVIACIVALSSLPGGHGHLMGICTATSPSIENRLVVLLATYKHQADHAVTPGELTISNGKDEYYFNFSNFAKINNFFDYNSPLQTWTNSIKNVFEKTEVDGRKILDATNTAVICYESRQADSGTRMMVGITGDKFPTSSRPGSTTTVGDIEYWYPVVLDNLPPGFYTMTKSGTNQILDPQPAGWGPAGLGSSGLLFEFGVAQPGRPCAGITLPTQTSNRAGSAQANDDIEAFCANRPSGFICPVLCPDGEDKASPAICSDGTYSSARCVDPQDSCQQPNRDTNPVAGWDSANDEHPTMLTQSKSECGQLLSANGANCSFLCNNSKYGVGEIQCRGGRWRVPAAGSVRCEVGSLKAPTDVRLSPEGAFAIRVFWFPGNIGASIDLVSRYTFEVSQPAASTLKCPPYNYKQPPVNGMVCACEQQGSCQLSSVEIRVVAEGRLGKKSPESEPVGLPCTFLAGDGNRSDDDYENTTTTSTTWGRGNSATQRLRDDTVCLDGLTIPHRGVCLATCAVGWAPSSSRLDCIGGILEPRSFVCEQLSCPGIAVKLQPSDDDCMCPSGYIGKPGWNPSAHVYTGDNCVMVSCPSYSQNHPECTCKKGFVGGPVWNSARGAWEGGCEIVDCPEGASHDEEAICKCSVESGFNGELTWNSMGGYYDHFCWSPKHNLASVWLAGLFSIVIPITLAFAAASLKPHLERHAPNAVTMLRGHYWLPVAAALGVLQLPQFALVAMRLPPSLQTFWQTWHLIIIGDVGMVLAVIFYNQAIV